MRESWESVVITVLWRDIDHNEWVSNFTDEESCEHFLLNLRHGEVLEIKTRVY